MTKNLFIMTSDDLAKFVTNLAKASTWGLELVLWWTPDFQTQKIALCLHISFQNAFKCVPLIQKNIWSTKISHVASKTADVASKTFDAEKPAYLFNSNIDWKMLKMYEKYTKKVSGNVRRFSNPLKHFWGRCELTLS